MSERSSNSPSPRSEEGEPIDTVRDFSRQPEWSEERFRVDRKKLEAMMQAAEAGKGESGEEFFQKIMFETNTDITWPSKMKIGAKSRKDPHIKVCGKRDSVREARQRIMAVLDTKSSRVTIKIDVPHVEHSYVIGRGGFNIRQVMEHTGCHIHFPDSNRSNAVEKSNQVSIAGFPSRVEAARVRIRDLVPFVLSFELPLAGMVQPLPDLSSPALQCIMQCYGLSLTLKPRAPLYGSICVVRGPQGAATKEGIIMLIEHLTSCPGTTFPVTCRIDVASQHHNFLMGHVGTNGSLIPQHTAAQVLFTEADMPHKAIFIHGSMDAVCSTRACLLGCLPLVLLFDLQDDVEVSPSKLAQIMDSLDVFISVKPKPRQLSRSVIVKSVEKNASNAYKARRLLLGLEGNEDPSQSEPKNCADTAMGLPLSTAALMLSPASQSVYTNILLASGFKPIPTSTSPHVTSPPPGLSLPAVHQVPTPSEVQSHGEANTLLTSASKSVLCPSAGIAQLTSLLHCRGIVEEEKEQNRGMGVGREDPYGGHPLIDSDELKDCSKDTFVEVGMPRFCSYDCMAYLDGTPTQSPSNKLIELGVEQHEGPSGKDIRGSSQHAGASESLIRRTHSTYSSLQTVDYEQKKILATKAMQRKPVVTEVRVPTNQWSGLGFSKSMPSEAMKLLRQNTYKPCMATTHEAEPHRCTSLREGGIGSVTLRIGAIEEEAQVVAQGNSILLPVVRVISSTQVQFMTIF
uniref:K Homology domain-containing protein n=1 Tax=Eptatretus burgeri TaxID=7764 RepID=A0A8C4R6P2_EPTBU